jgi:tetratricopeptide (TPR) repeat protein
MQDTTDTITTALQRHQAGRLERAEQLYQQALQSDPANPTALHSLGLLAYQKGENLIAVELINKAIESNQDVPQFYNNLAVALKALGRFKEAVDACGKALALKPDYANAYYNLGNTLASLRLYNQAVEQYKKALLFKPDDAFTYYNIGVAMQELDQHTEAIDCFSRTIQLNHNPTEVYRAMAASQKSLGWYTDAVNTMKRALYLKPDCAATHTDYGMMLLLVGDFVNGWNEYRWRVKGNCWKNFPDSLRWDGSNFAGKELFVRSEQGLGDNIQFVRYLPMVKERGGTVIFGVYEQLYSLLKDFPGADETVNLSVEDRKLTFDLCAPLMDLPGIFGTTLETIPNQVPYIFADPAKTRYWQNRLSVPAFKIGIVWSGSFGRGGKHLRDCKLTDFTDLAAIEGVRLYSLQKGKAAEQIERLAVQFPVVNLGRHFKDLSDTAAAIENLDLIISVDTSVLHLAAAMGKQTWALQCFAPDWRWMLYRTDSPWYPTMRLFRQRKLGHWEGVFRQIKSQLQKLVAAQKITV